MTKNGGSQTVDRALEVLDAVAACTVPPRLSDVAQAVGLNITTTSRLLASLQRFGYVRRDEITGVYRLGYKILHMANVVQEQAGLREIVDPVLQQLVEVTNETAMLTIAQGEEAIIVARVTCSNELRSSAPIGGRVPMYCTSAGKLLLAHASPAHIDAVLGLGMPCRTPHTITTRAAMLVELQAIRDQGYALDRGEREDGLIGISAPVRDVRSKVIAACSISGSEQRMPLERVPELAEHVRTAALELSKRIGWQSSRSLVESMVAV